MINYVLGISLLILVSAFSSYAGYYYGKNNKGKTDCLEVIDGLLNQLTTTQGKLELEPLTPTEFKKLQSLLYVRELVTGKKK